MKLSEKGKSYLMYHARWQAGIVFSWPVLYLLQQVLHFGYFMTLISFSFLGAVFFWPIDRWILNRKNKKEVVKAPRIAKVSYPIPKNVTKPQILNKGKVNVKKYNRTQHK